MTSKSETNLPAEAPEQQVEGYSLSQRAAAQCREIVESTAKDIEGRRYVEVSGWQAIAIAHGCVASARSVEAVYEGEKFTGYKAVGEVRRMSDGVVIATGEGFVGTDEAVWFGGKRGYKTYYPRPTYAIKAMAQTRGISRACRSAFAHVVVLINKNLSTTPAEEMIDLHLEGEPGTPPPPPPLAPKAPETPPPAPPVVERSMMDDARQMSRESGYNPDTDKARGQYRKRGAPMTPAEIERKKIDQLDAAFNWINDQAPVIQLMTPEEVLRWQDEPEIAPRIKAMEQGKNQQPGFEHLAPAWDRLQKIIEQVQGPPQ